MVILLFSKKIRIIKNKLCISLCTDGPPPSEKNLREGDVCTQASYVCTL